MSTAVLTNRLELSSVADSTLKAAARFWFAVTIVGQLIFAFAVASFYGLTALRGDYHGWKISNGFVPGVTKANWAVAMHLASAAVIMLAGAIQLVPQVRNRFPKFHHWNGRIYMLTAVTGSFAGVYMTWFRGSVGDLPQHIGGTLNAALIWLFAGMALRYAMARDFRTHRRWALRLFLVTSAAWFYRIVFFLLLAIFKAPVGFDPATFTGPFPTIMSFAQYLFPLSVLELYFLAQDRPSAPRRFATASLLIVLTLAMAAGLFVVTMAIWLPDVKAAFDPRKSIAETLSATEASSGVEAAVKQYHELKAGTTITTYNFDEGELNSLGYRLIRGKRYAEGIRIFQLNVEAYPNSSNAYDSLAEGYMKAGDKAEAIAYYRKAIELNPKNGNSISMLKKLTAQ
jgi:tetratricopeptide (TPR) repeat protein